MHLFYVRRPTEPRGRLLSLTVRTPPTVRGNVQPGDVMSVVVSPRDGNHSCDLTAVDLNLSDGTRTWDLAKDVSPNILKGNPHGAWHFLSQPATLDSAPDVPAPIAEWRKKPSPELAVKVRQYLEKDFPLNSPLLRAFLNDRSDRTDPSDLTAKAPSVLEVKIPAALANGMEFVVTGKLASNTHGSVQMQVLATKPASSPGLAAGVVSEQGGKSTWSDGERPVVSDSPIIVTDGSAARKRIEAALDEFRQLFPAALCYTKIVPVDEVERDVELPGEEVAGAQLGAQAAGDELVGCWRAESSIHQRQRPIRGAAMSRRRGMALLGS